MSWEYFVAPLLEHNPAGGTSLVAYLKRPRS